MSDASNFSPQSFAVVGAGPVGCIVAGFLAKGGYEVTLCDVIPDLLSPALDRGIILEGAENLKQKVKRTCANIDELADVNPDVIFITVKANALPLIASAIEGFHREGLAIVSWQNGIDTELELAKILGKDDVMRAVVNYGCAHWLDRLTSEYRFTTRPTSFRSWIRNPETRPWSSPRY